MKNNRGMLKNTRGWIRIVEAFVAVLLITGVVLIVVDKGYIKKQDSSKEIYEVENSVLRNIQTNDSLREEILNSNAPIDSTNNTFPGLINQTINLNIPAYLNCLSKICLIDDPCLYPISLNENIYSRSAIISADLTNYNPKQIKLFCFRK
jgi:hypothetical protein